MKNNKNEDRKTEDNRKAHKKHRTTIIKLHKDEKTK